jgi:FkbM family methyltransferase
MKKVVRTTKVWIKSLVYIIASYLFYRKGVAKVINKATIRFPLAYSRYYPYNYEPLKQEFIEKYAQGICVDLGAHIGLYTVLLSRQATQVIAFEPTSYTRNVLNQTITLNGCRNVLIREEAIAEDSIKRSFYDTGDKVSNANSFAPIGNPIYVQTISLDELNLQIDFLKVDIEGAELLALKGAVKSLKFIKYMTLEIHPSLLNQLGQQVSEIFELLKPFQPQYYLEGVLVNVDQLENIENFFEVNVILNGAKV